MAVEDMAGAGESIGSANMSSKSMLGSGFKEVGLGRQSAVGGRASGSRLERSDGRIKKGIIKEEPREHEIVQAEMVELGRQPILLPCFIKRPCDHSCFNFPPTHPSCPPKTPKRSLSRSSRRTPSANTCTPSSAAKVLLFPSLSSSFSDLSQCTMSPSSWMRYLSTLLSYPTSPSTNPPQHPGGDEVILSEAGLCFSLSNYTTLSSTWCFPRQGRHRGI